VSDFVGELIIKIEIGKKKDELIMKKKW